MIETAAVMIDERLIASLKFEGGRYKNAIIQTLLTSPNIKIDLLLWNENDDPIGLSGQLAMSELEEVAGFLNQPFDAVLDDTRQALSTANGHSNFSYECDVERRRFTYRKSDVYKIDVEEMELNAGLCFTMLRNAVQLIATMQEQRQEIEKKLARVEEAYDELKRANECESALNSLDLTGAFLQILNASRSGSHRPVVRDATPTNNETNFDFRPLSPVATTTTTASTSTSTSNGLSALRKRNKVGTANETRKTARLSSETTEPTPSTSGIGQQTRVLDEASPKTDEKVPSPVRNEHVVEKRVKEHVENKIKLDEPTEVVSRLDVTVARVDDSVGVDDDVDALLAEAQKMFAKEERNTDSIYERDTEVMMENM